MNLTFQLLYCIYNNDHSCYCIVATHILNHDPKETTPSGLDKFLDLPTAARCHMCYYPSDVIVKVFPDKIEDLAEKESKD